MKDVLKSLVKALKLRKDDGFYYLGNSSTPNNGNKILSQIEKADPELYNNNAPKAILNIIDELINEMSAERQNSQGSVYDKTLFLNALQSILDEEDLVLDFENNNFKKIIGHDSNGTELLTSIDNNAFNTKIKVNEDARALNTEGKSYAKEILNYVTYYKDNLKEEMLRKLYNDVKYNSALEGYFDEFAKKLHSVYNCVEDLDVFTVLLKQHYWQLKRRMLERNIHNDIMLTFRGSQGIGKTHLINAIFGSVLGRFSNPSAKLDDIIDERWTPALGNMLLISIDETDTGKLGTLKGTQMGAIKSRITNDRFTYRPLGTNDQVEVRKKATFISTSNFHIYEIMGDSSGMRRFFEFNSRNITQQRFNYEAVNELKVNALKAFQSIDEDLEYGYWDVDNDVGKKISKIQQTYVPISPIDDFINEQLIVDLDLEFNKCMGIDQLYSEYREFSKKQGLSDSYIVIKKNFKKKIEEAVYDITKTSHNVSRFKVKMKKDIYNEPKKEIREESKTANSIYNTNPDDAWMYTQVGEA